MNRSCHNQIRYSEEECSKSQSNANHDNCNKKGQLLSHIKQQRRKLQHVKEASKVNMIMEPTKW